jgi:pilus assembly protein CpaF
MTAEVAIPFGMRPIAPLLADHEVVEVMINGPGPVFVERRGRLERSGVAVTGHELALLIEHVMAPLGLRVDRSSPMVDARLADGSRVNVVVPPLAVDGPLVCIRRFPDQPIPLSAFGPPELVGLLRRLVADRATVLIVGPTSSGKTTLLGSLTAEVATNERLVCIEDTAELHVHGANVARLEARPANSEGVGAVSMGQLVLNALRMRPDRLIVGEVRGGEAFDLLLALTSGHRGCLATCHGLDAPGGLRRLETLALLSGTPLGSPGVRTLIGDAVDAVVTTTRRRGRRLVASVEVLDGGHLMPVWSIDRAVGASHLQERAA